MGCDIYVNMLSYLIWHGNEINKELKIERFVWPWHRFYCIYNHLRAILYNAIILWTKVDFNRGVLIFADFSCWDVNSLRSINQIVGWTNVGIFEKNVWCLGKRSSKNTDSYHKGFVFKHVVLFESKMLIPDFHFQTEQNLFFF